MNNQISSSYTELSTTIWTNIVILFQNFYKDYRPLFHILGSIIIIYSFYHLGKWKRPSALQKKIIAINLYEDNIQKVSAAQRKRFKLIKTIKYVFGFILMIGVLFNIMLYLSPKEINNLLISLHLSPIRQLNEKISITGGSILIFIIVWVGLMKILKYFATIDKKHLTQLQQQEEPELNQVMKSLGPKALEKIKQNQCQKILESLQQKQNDAGGCSKCHKNNSEYNLLKQKYDNYVQFITSVFSFKWCDICSFKKKTPPYEQSQLPIPQKPFSSEQQEVAYRVSQLYKRCQKLNSYLKSLCQKNCSYNYWKQSKKNGKKFMGMKTDLEHQLQAYHGKR